MKLKVKKLHEDAIIPTRTNPDDCGLDVYALEDVKIYSGQTKKIRTGISLQLDVDYRVEKKFGLFIWDRSGLGSRGIHRFAGCIDQGYSGEVLVVLFNAQLEDVSTGSGHGPNYYIPYQIKKGDKIAQVVIQEIFTPEIVVVDELDSTDRGENGFGSSGK